MLAYSVDLKKYPVEGELEINITQHKTNDRPNHRMDIYGTKVLPNHSPIFAFIHGGYWQVWQKIIFVIVCVIFVFILLRFIFLQEGSKEVAKSMVRSLISSGVIVAVIGYDLSPAISMDEIVEEIADSITYLNNWATERKSQGLYVSGHSAGAHLTFMGMVRARCSLTSVKGIMLLSGIYDLKPLLNTYLNNALK